MNNFSYKSQLESELYNNLEYSMRLLRKWEAVEITTYTDISQLAIIIESQEEHGR